MNPISMNALDRAWSLGPGTVVQSNDLDIEAARRRATVAADARTLQPRLTAAVTFLVDLLGGGTLLQQRSP
jgi:hypothetical protein